MIINNDGHTSIVQPDAEDLLFAFTAQEMMLRQKRYLPKFGEVLLREPQKQYYCFAQHHGRRCILLEDNDLLKQQENFDWINVRTAVQLLNETEYPLAVLGKHLLHWRRLSRFCGSCGAANEDSKQERARICTVCHTVQFPRIAPVAIVLITRGVELLLARSAHFQPGVYSAVAGFVEAGESLEAAAHREVREEVGVNIKNLQYICSQAWPYPDSLMLGFIAEYESGELVIDKTEIEDAAWFTTWNLPQLPSATSIAHHLIAYYLQQINSAN